MSDLPFLREELPTPALVLDRAALDANIAAMAAFAAAHGISLRPHAKTHKSADIARRQIAAGAVGLCCAKLGEAEALAQPAFLNLHLTSPVVSQGGIARLMLLSGKSESLSVVADHPDNVRALGIAAAAEGRSLSVFVDINPGGDRTGVTSTEHAVALARAILDAPALTFGGVQFYCGPQQHVVAFAERRTQIAAKTDDLRRYLAALDDAGVAVPVVTGGGTGSFPIDAELGVLTELQVGSYVFLDREYDECEPGDDAPRFAPSLMVDATVISANVPGRVTLDAGIKAFATEAGVPRIVSGAPSGTRYVFMGDEHGGLILGDGPAPHLGDRVTLMTPHCDPTVNLYDDYWVTENDRIIDRWPVTARGRST